MRDITKPTFPSHTIFREAAYFYTAELIFRIKLKRNYLFALWATNLLGYPRKMAEAYIKELTIAELQPFGEGTILPKVIAALKKAQVDITERRVQTSFDQCWESAYQMVMSEQGESQ